MIQIICPNNNNPERTYAIEVLFTDVLGCKHDDYSILFRNDTQNYEVDVEGKKYIIEDHFFNQHPEPLSYLNLENFPKELIYFHGLGLELPIIYGEDKFVQNEDGAIIGLDIFASTFFMLTRWEEFLLGREEKGDCDESKLFCVKHGIHQRPIVNEYADFLRKLLPSDIILSTRKYEVVLSHDVDGFLTPTWSRIAKDFVKQTIHGAPKNKVLNLTWKEEIKYKHAFPSAYGQFKMYTTLCEKCNVQEWFYFKVCGKGEKEATYLYDDGQTKRIIENLRTKNNPRIVLGFHPSQNMFGKREQWNKEVTRITDLLHEVPNIGRNHHLLYNHETLRMWDSMTESPMNISNCVFHKINGFRSGVCVPYHLFDLFQRKMMSLVEHPCQIMDIVIRYSKKNKTKEERWHDIQAIVEQVKKHQGELVLTWHIYIRTKSLIQEYYQWCEKTVNYAIQ